MPAPVPSHIKTDREKWLWGHLAQLYGEYCGNDNALFDERTKEFQSMLRLVDEELEAGTHRPRYKD